MLIEIYKLTNIKENQIYIGVSSKGAWSRWRDHLSSAKKHNVHRPLVKAIRKYGEEAFTLEIIRIVRSYQEAYRAERYYIAKYNSFGPGGYNMTKGGQVIPQSTRDSISRANKARVGMKYKRHVDLKMLSEKLRKQSTGRKQSEETIQKRCLKLRGKKRSKNFCEETRNRVLAEGEIKRAIRLLNPAVRFYPSCYRYVDHSTP